MDSQMSVNKELLKNLQAKKAALNDEFMFNQNMKKQEYLARYHELNMLIRPLEFKETFEKNDKKRKNRTR